MRYRTNRTDHVKKAPILIVICISLVVFFSEVAHATQYDLAADWSDAANPNGVWTYRQGSSALPYVANWTPLGIATTQPAWAPSAVAGNFLPAWFRSMGNNPGGIDVQIGDIVVHSTDSFNGASNGPANILWTSPGTGTANLSGDIWLARDIGRSNDWSIVLNGSTLTKGTVASGDPYSRSIPFLFSAGTGGAAALSNVSVSAGDAIQLFVVRSPTSTSGGDFAGVNLTIDFTAGQPVPGDYNHNGVVDAADYTVWSLGQTGAGLAADGNHNNQIDAGDYDVWKSNFGNHAGSGSGSVAGVPEPTSLSMLLVGILTMCCRRRSIVP